LRRIPNLEAVALAFSANHSGALFMSVSMAGLTVNDAFVKFAATGMNMGQVMFVRGLFATMLVGMLAWHQGTLRAPRLILHPMVVLRAFFELAGTMLFLVALVNLPIGEV